MPVSGIRSNGWQVNATTAILNQGCGSLVHSYASCTSNPNPEPVVLPPPKTKNRGRSLSRNPRPQIRAPVKPTPPEKVISAPAKPTNPEKIMETVVSVDAPDAVIQDTLEAQAILWDNTFCFIKSMSLKSAAELRIPDAILRHGMPTTISDLISSLSIPEAKSRHLRTLMPILSQEGIFKFHITLSGEETFDLTHVSRLLTTTSIAQRRLNYTPFILFQVEQHIIYPYHQLSHWFHRPDVIITPLEMTHGKTFWELAGTLPEFNDSFNKGMACDSAFVADVQNIGGDVFRGIGTLVDVGGRTGVMVAAFVEAFPGL
ncbi:Trans-resveratrol di-O-methyltransferase [Dendrobium catenatum]|uniref:Trans-resveratrol di-O-methyltransferase n=1 Tax=Dendrobium catenatum TaxID=906689 RepID=A0A2I0X1Q9_9ASPA|nr:Trans-resveratrol di-O-methyltransferase [Dendrobium catenatum]